MQGIKVDRSRLHVAEQKVGVVKVAMHRTPGGVRMPEPRYESLDASSSALNGDELIC